MTLRVGGGLGAGSAAQVLYQWGLPVMIPSSGSFGNNGALTGLTAVPTTFANCYMYFPAGAISSGSAAGFYYAQMSSTTAATVFNNTLPTTGAPQVLASPTAFSTTGPGAYTQSTSAQASVTLPIAGGLMGPGGALHFKVRVSSANNTDSRSLTVSLGGTQIANANSTVEWYGFERTFQNLGSQAANAVYANATGNTGTDILFTASLPSFSTVNTANSQNLIFNMTIGIATDFMILLGGAVDVTYAP